MAIEYIDLTKESNEATLIVEDGALHVTGGTGTTASGVSNITVINTALNPVPVLGSVIVTSGVSTLPNPLPVTVSGELTIANTPLPISENWRVTLIQDEALNSSNKLFTVPANQEWQVLWIWAEFITSTGIGTRQLSVEILDSAADIIAEYQVGVTQATTLTRNYLIAPVMPDLSSFRDTSYLTTPLPPTIILASGQQIRVWDNKAFDPSHDSLVVQLQHAFRTI
jgi:hypothetical protein